MLLKRKPCTQLDVMLPSISNDVLLKQVEQKRGHDKHNQNDVVNCRAAEVLLHRQQCDKRCKEASNPPVQLRAEDSEVEATTPYAQLTDSEQVECTSTGRPQDLHRREDQSLRILSG